jgi:gliding motility-associated-like protein
MRRIVYYLLVVSCLQALPLKAQKLSFIENKNQWDPFIRYKTNIPQGHIYFTNNQFRYVFYDQKDIDRIHELKHDNYVDAYKALIDCYAYDLKFVDANTKPQLVSENKKPEYHNYFIGNDQQRWAGQVGLYEAVVYQNLYPGVDVRAYSIQNSFKYDVIVKAHANPAVVKIKYNGIEPTLKPDGSISLALGFKTVQESAPYTYQIIDGKKVEVKSAYRLNAKGEVEFVFPMGYNTQADLIIDPTLIFSTYSSSTATTYGFSATYDLSGSLYAGGECFGVGWPSTVGAFQLAYAGGVDCGINKYNPTGSAIIYSTYFGGSGSDLPNNMVVNAANELAMTGSTSSGNMPTTAGCYDNTLGGNSDAYVVHFNATGTALIGSTFVGGSGGDAQNSGALSPNYGDFNRGEIAYDNNGDIIVAVSTNSNDFPTTLGAFQTAFGGGGQDGCVFRVTSTCNSLQFSTFLGGNGLDACFSIVKNSVGNWVVVGGTTSPNFPAQASSNQPVYQGATDGFIVILNGNFNGVVNSTFIGTPSFDHAFKVQVDNQDTVYVCGQTESALFPISTGVYSNPNSNIFIQKYTPNLGAMVLSTIIGDVGSNLIPTAFLKDNCGNVYFTGFGAQAGLALTADAHQNTTGGFWLSVLTGDFTSLVYATYMGAAGDHVDGGTSRFDPQGIVYHSVCTASASQYQSPGCLSPTNQASSWDVASFKFDFEAAPINASLTIAPNDTGCAPYTMVFNNTSTSATSFLWDFNDGTTSTLSSPVHTFQTEGVYNVRLIAMSPNSCFGNDTAYVTIHVAPEVYADFQAEVTLGCSKDTISFAIDSLNQGANVTFQWYFGDGAQSNVPIISHTYNSQNTYTVMSTASNGFCKDTMIQVFDLNHPIIPNFFTATSFGSLPVDSICLGTKLFASAVISFPQGFLDYSWNWGDGTQYNFSSDFDTSHLYTEGGSYLITLTIRDSLGCTDTAQQWVYVEDASSQSVVSSDSLVCVGDPVKFIDSIVTTTGTLVWDFADGSVSQNVHHPVHSWDKAGTYIVTLTTIYQVCPSITSTLTVEVEDYPDINLGADTSICPGITGTIFINNQINPNQVMEWSTGEITNTLSVVNPGRYWASYTSPTAGCKTIDSITVTRDCYLNIPNSFSPDGDGLNDYFIPRELLSSGVTVFNMNIYNRWGELVFNTSTIDGRGWDGKYDGKLQNMGVYVYVIDVVFANKVKKTYKGNVTLVR